MPLRPPEDGQSFEDLILRVNEGAGPQGYAVVLLRTKKTKLGVKNKAWIKCDRRGKTREPQGQLSL